MLDVGSILIAKEHMKNGVLIAIGLEWN